MLHLELIDQCERLTLLQQEWSALAAAAQNIPIFLTWEWITVWWQHYGQGHDLYVLTARDDDGELAGIAPWMILKRHWMAQPVRCVAFIGTGEVYPAHMDVIARPGDEDQVAAAFAGYLGEHADDWDALDFVSVSGDSMLPKYLAQGDGRHASGGEMNCLYIPLEADWETYQQVHMSAKQRRNARYYHNRLERDFPDQIAFTRVETQVELDYALEALREMNLARWTSQGFTTPFMHEKYVAFHRDIAALALERGWLRFFILEVAGKFAAVNYCFSYGRAYYDYQHSFDMDLWKYSTGRVLMTHVIEQAINEGKCEIDLLHGDQGYKHLWTEMSRTNHHILCGTSFRGNMWLSSALLKDRLADFSRESLPEELRTRVNQIISAFNR